MAMNGTDILLLVNTGTTLVPVYEAVGCQRDVTFDETTEEIDASCKDSRAKRVLAGRYGATISLDGVYVPTCDAYNALKDAMRNGDLILVACEEEGVTTETATALVTALSKMAPDQDVATISVSLTIDGEWVEVGT